MWFRAGDCQNTPSGKSIPGTSKSQEGGSLHAESRCYLQGIMGNQSSQLEPSVDPISPNQQGLQMVTTVIRRKEKLCDESPSEGESVGLQAGRREDQRGLIKFVLFHFVFRNRLQRAPSGCEETLTWV